MKVRTPSHVLPLVSLSIGSRSRRNSMTGGYDSVLVLERVSALYSVALPTVFTRPTLSGYLTEISETRIVKLR